MVSEYHYFIGGVAGLILCLLTKLQKYRDDKKMNVLVEINTRLLFFEQLNYILCC